MPPMLQELLDRVGGARRAAILATGLGAALGVLALARWASAPTWVSAFGSVPIEEIGSIGDRLTQARISFKLDPTGTQVLVPSTDVARARVALARNGGLPGGGGRPGFELFDQPTWGQTDMTQRVNYRRALEGELERTIGQMRGIAAAKVHLVVRQQDAYAESPTPAEASVVLTLRGDALPPEVVKGIAHTVASSVDGLVASRVTIVDDAGRLLSEAEEDNSPTALTNRQLALQQEVERYLREKAERLVMPVVGSGNVKVQVAATLGFDRVERTATTVDPDRQVVATSQKAEIIPGAQGGAASTNQATAYQNSTTTESVSGAVGALQRLTVAVLVGIPTPVAGDSAGAAAVRQPTPAQMATIESLVKGAVGYDSTRGDLVTVAALPLAPVALPVPAERSMTETISAVQRPALGAAGILLAFVVGLMAIKAAGRAPAPRLAMAGVAAGGGRGAMLEPRSMPGGAPMARAVAAPREMPVIEIPNNPVRDKVVASAEQQPVVAAKVMRAWLRES